MGTHHTSRAIGTGPLAAWLVLTALLASVATLPAAEAPPNQDLFKSWRVFTKKDGLPSNKVMAVAVDEQRVWAGTEKGLALVENGSIRRVDDAGDLPFPAVTALAVSPDTGDLWIGTLGGLGRLSGGRFQQFNQLNSGLANDVVYGVASDGKAVWIATAAGLNRFDPATGAWAIYDTTNTLMHEPWCYAVTLAGETVYTAVWGSGVLVHDTATGGFRTHRDPDHEMEIDLFRDDGLVHDVTSAVAFAEDTLWVGTYFGLSRYQGRRWRSWYADESGLAGDFINFLKADGTAVWIATDQGLSRYMAPLWHTWRRDQTAGGYRLEISTDDGEPTVLHPQAGPPDNTVFGIDLDARGVWLATAAGLAHGTLTSSAMQAPPTPSTGHRQGEQP